MRIDNYSFGSITISGNSYSKDVIIFSDRVFSPWWRKEGHLLQVEDLVEIVKGKFTELFIGTGYYGTMKVSPEVKDYLTIRGIMFHIENTPKIVQSFNSAISERAAVAALHLTC